MKNELTNCSLKDAAFAFFLLIREREGFFWKEISKVIKQKSIFLGFTLIPRHVSLFLRQYIYQGEAFFGEDRLEFYIFLYDLDKVSKEEREDYIVECQERIVFLSSRKEHAVVWVFAPPQLGRVLAKNFYDGGANVYFHKEKFKTEETSFCSRGRVKNDEIHAIISEDPEMEVNFPKTFFVHENLIFPQNSMCYPNMSQN